MSGGFQFAFSFTGATGEFRHMMDVRRTGGLQGSRDNGPVCNGNSYATGCEGEEESPVNSGEAHSGGLKVFWALKGGKNTMCARVMSALDHICDAGV